MLAHGFIDHCGIVGDYELTDGTKVSSPIRRPHSYYLAEAFKIRAGAIEQVEADFITVPYHMPTPVGCAHGGPRHDRTQAGGAGPDGRRDGDRRLRPQRDGAGAALARAGNGPAADRLRAGRSRRTCWASAPGAFLIAPLGDRIGASRSSCGGVLGIAVATAATSLRDRGFAIRLLAAANRPRARRVPRATSRRLSSEVAPEGKRSTVMAVVSAGIAIGAMVAGFTAPGTGRRRRLAGACSSCPAGDRAGASASGSRCSARRGQAGAEAAEAKVPLIELAAPAAGASRWPCSRCTT